MNVIAPKFWHGFWQQQQGATAVEFALIVPLLAMLLLGTVELSNRGIVDRKIGSVANVVGDLVTQNRTISNATLADLYAAADAVMFPSAVAPMSIVITSLVSEGSASPYSLRVVWSESRPAGQARSANSIYTRPDGVPELVTASGEGIILVEVSYNYPSLFGGNFVGGATIREVSFAKPRRSFTVARVP